MLEHFSARACNAVLSDARRSSAAALQRFGSEDRSPSEALSFCKRRRVIFRAFALGQENATAESCIGGRAADLLTNATGSSNVFGLRIIAYVDRCQEQLLGVPEALLAEHGAASQACVEAMVRSARKRVGSTFGVAVSGIAGPKEESREKSVSGDGAFRAGQCRLHTAFASRIFLRSRAQQGAFCLCGTLAIAVGATSCLP